MFKSRSRDKHRARQRHVSLISQYCDINTSTPLNGSIPLYCSVPALGNYGKRMQDIYIFEEGAAVFNQLRVVKHVLAQEA